MLQLLLLLLCCCICPLQHVELALPWTQQKMQAASHLLLLQYLQTHTL
jgi:hypothetical protein